MLYEFGTFPWYQLCTNLIWCKYLVCISSIKVFNCQNPQISCKNMHYCFFIGRRNFCRKITRYHAAVRVFCEFTIRGGFNIQMWSDQYTDSHYLIIITEMPMPGKTVFILRQGPDLCLIKGLRPVLEGFVVTMHEGACKTGSQIPRALARGIWRTVRTSPSALCNKTRQIGLNHDYNMTFSISSREC